MLCELCEKETDSIVVLPIGKEGGCLNTLSCLSCAEESGVYCKKHKRPHLGFEDGTTACVSCIQVAMNMFDELGVCKKLRGEISTLEWHSLLLWGAEVAGVTGDTPQICILRAIVTKALRLDKSVEHVVGSVIRTGSEFILA